jgi:hypothetical protein
MKKREDIKNGLREKPRSRQLSLQHSCKEPKPKKENGKDAY